MGFWDELFGWSRERTPPALTETRFDNAVRMDAASVQNMMTGIGTSGDKGAVSRPNPMVMPLSEQELDALWQHNGIARKLVEIFPRRATREGWEAPDMPPTEEKRLRLRMNVREAMTWAQLYGGCAMLMVTEDDVPAQYQDNPRGWLKQPLQRHRIGKLHSLQVFDIYAASPQKWDEDIKSPNYRMPETWDIADDGFNAEVHHSRVVHFRGARRPPSQRRQGFRTGFSNLPDAPYLQHLWDNIRNFNDTMNGGAHVAQELRHAVMKVGDLNSMMVGADSTKIPARMRLFQQLLSSIGIAIIGPQDEYEQRTTPPTGFAELSDAAKSVLSAVSNIPEQEFWGSSPAGFNTDGDSGKEGFRAAVSDFQEEHREPLEKTYKVIYSAQDGPTRGKEPDAGWEIKFRPLDEPSEATQAELRRTVAETDAMLIDNGMLSPEHVRRHRYGPDGWKFDIPGLDLAEIQELEFEDDAREQMQQLQQQQAMMAPQQPPMPGQPGQPPQPGQPNEDVPPTP